PFPYTTLFRSCQAYFDLGDGILLTVNEPHLFTDAAWSQESETDRTLLRLVKRGQAEGAIDPDLTPEGVQNVLWALLYAAWMHARGDDVPEHDALALCLRTRRTAAGPRAPSPGGRRRRPGAVPAPSSVGRPGG